MYHSLLKSFLHPAQTAISVGSAVRHSKCSRPTTLTDHTYATAERLIPLSISAAYELSKKVLNGLDCQQVLQNLWPCQGLVFQPLGVHTNALDRYTLVYHTNQGPIFEISAIGAKSQLHGKMSANNLSDYLKQPNDTEWLELKTPSCENLFNPNAGAFLKLFSSPHPLDSYHGLHKAPEGMDCLGILALETLEQFTGSITTRFSERLSDFIEKFEGACIQVCKTDTMFDATLHILHETILKDVIVQFTHQPPPCLSFNDVYFLGILSILSKDKLMATYRFLALNSKGELFCCDPVFATWRNIKMNIANLKSSSLNILYATKQKRAHPCYVPVKDESVNSAVQCAILQTMCPTYSLGGFRKKHPMISGSCYSNPLLRHVASPPIPTDFSIPENTDNYYLFGEYKMVY
ncbi:beta-beta-alpha motif protein [Ranid herpesvirus 3]|uniref:Beta-beta-alpha motif protein n=1 Tax=Ranid herpesvirus 3 TaxID=1987509 RepID=A0A1X9T518_9VIRU|nr:beta-beta-alpha motif protein [Ranid herpesvirus 3]ARR28812.1 beta-beta-alpha motif protein [Ranid herpesvirus 3]